MKKLTMPFLIGIVSLTCLLLFPTTAHCLKNTEVSSILKFCKNNGKRHLNILTLDEQDPNVQVALEEFSFKAKLENTMYTRNAKQKDENVVSTLIKFHQDSLVILTSATDTTHWTKYLEMMTRTRIMSSMIVIIGDLNKEHIRMMKSLLENLSTNSFFYWIYKDVRYTNEMMWNQVLTLDNYDQIVTNQLTFNPTNGIIVEGYNLQGLHLVSMTLSWAPYFTVSNCQEGNHPKGFNKKCDTSGYLHETMNLFSRTLNFTWESHAEPANKWGTAPISGPANVSGEWGGIFGYLMRHDYQFSISTWIWNENRNDMFDFITIIGDRMVLIAKPQRDPIDPGLFIRPFRKEAWYVVGITVAVIIGCLVIPTMFAPRFSDTTSFRVVSSIGWLFFMLLEIYYSGALTMFFSTEVSLPFETTKDVMQAYDYWKLMMRYGNDVYFIRKVSEGDPCYVAFFIFTLLYYFYFFIGKVSEGDPDYVAFWDRKNNLPEETVFNSVSEGVDLMLNNLIVIHLQEGAIRGFVKDNPEKGQGIRLFDKGSIRPYNLIVVDNSPLGPVFRFAARNVMERGILDPVVNSWIGKEVGNERPDLEETKLVLGAGQVVLIFFILCAITFSTLAVLLGEHIYSRSKTLQKTVMETNEFLEDFQRDGFEVVRRRSTLFRSSIPDIHN